MTAPETQGPTVTLLPCPNPWCPSTTAPLPVKSTYSDDAWRVRCACGVTTYRCDSEAEAIAAWNTRHREAAEAASREREAVLVSLLTKAVGDIGAALIMADREALIGEWTAEYTSAINAHDAALAHRSQSDAALSDAGGE